MSAPYDAATHAGLRRYFDSGKTRPLEWRRAQLRSLDAFVREREAEIADAIHADLRKPAGEIWLGETWFVRSEIKHALKHLRQWMRLRRVSVPLPYQPASAFIERDPVGVALIIGTWNYPVALTLGPLVGALAGGNCVVLKPSEMAPASSRLLAEKIGHYLDPEAIKVVEGDGAVSAELLKHRFDHIFFTGSRWKGQAVMEAAARHLTPVTLELGGKCPVIVTEKADLRVAARRIVWAKFTNVGQTCVAPDYLLAHESVEEPLLRLMQEAIEEFYGSDPQSSADYGRVVDGRAFRRIDALMREGELCTGGCGDEASRYIAPTIIRNFPADSRLMEDEIFGPVLPVLTFSSLAAAVSIVRSRPDPLAVYLFSRDRAELDYLRTNTRSGGVCCNDLMFQITIPGLPFGGRGISGTGLYHGKAGFETFTAPRSVLRRSTFPDPVMRYPPFAGDRLAFLKRIFTIFS
ncbi:MAG: aldehyde dehydrogenase family protein [Chlorobaculum sp.]|nr:aldehyde dehydrogenase family protein [Chlorobaculum sp.]